MNQEITVMNYFRCEERVKQLGFKLILGGVGFQILNDSNKVLAKCTKICSFETLEEVSAWISGLESGIFYQEKKVFE